MSLHNLTAPDLPDEPTEADPALLLAALDALDIGVMICDQRGRLVLHNQAARRELADGGVLQLGADSLLDVQGGAGLLALRRAVHGAAFQRSHHLVPLRVGERLLMLAVQPLQVVRDGAPRVLLLMRRRGLCPDLALQHLARVHALTAAEADVLALLLAGVRIGDLARERGVKLATVRTQVAALRAKLGVRRVDDITRLVAELPPMLSVLGRGDAHGHVHHQTPPPPRLPPAAGPH